MRQSELFRDPHFLRHASRWAVRAAPGTMLLSMVGHRDTIMVVIFHPNLRALFRELQQNPIIRNGWRVTPYYRVRYSQPGDNEGTQRQILDECTPQFPNVREWLDSHYWRDADTPDETNAYGWPFLRGLMAPTFVALSITFGLFLLGAVAKMMGGEPMKAGHLALFFVRIAAWCNTVMCLLVLLQQRYRMRWQVRFTVWAILSITFILIDCLYL